MKGIGKMLENTPDTLTVKDLQRVLHIGKNMSLRLINENIIEAHKIGGKWVIMKEDVIEYIKRN